MTRPVLVCCNGLHLSHSSRLGPFPPAERSESFPCDGGSSLKTRLSAWILSARNRFEFRSCRSLCFPRPPTLSTLLIARLSCSCFSLELFIQLLSGATWLLSA